MAGKQILLNAFNMNCVGHINHGLWTHPRDRSDTYHSLDYWIDQARTLERGLFDGLFIADIVGTYDVYGGNVDTTLRESIQFLPVYLPQEELLNRLFAFVATNKDRLMHLIHSTRYIRQPTCVREITNEFVVEIVDSVLERYRQGEIDSGERAIHRIQWPYDEIEFPYEDLSNFRDIETDQEVMLDPIRQRQDYLNRLNQFCTEIRNGSTGSGADYRLVNTSDPIEVVLRDYLIFRRQR